MLSGSRSLVHADGSQDLGEVLRDSVVAEVRGSTQAGGEDLHIPEK